MVKRRSGDATRRRFLNRICVSIHLSLERILKGIPTPEEYNPIPISQVSKVLKDISEGKNLDKALEDNETWTALDEISFSRGQDHPDDLSLQLDSQQGL